MKKGKIVHLEDDIDNDILNTGIKFDVLIYRYINRGWDGNGLAIWRNKGKWSYSELGHCSCYGPTDNMSQDANVVNKLEHIKKILPNYEYGGGLKVLDYLNSKRYV